MSFNLGTTDVYTDPNSIFDPLIIAYAQAVKLPFNVGVFYELMAAPSLPISRIDYQVRTRTSTSLNDVIGDNAGTGWDASSTTSLPMTADAVALLTVGTVMKVESEVVVVKSVDRSGNTIDVFARGAGSTTGATHADQVPYSVIGSAGNDVDLKNVESRSEATKKYTNYTQTIFETIDYTFKANLVGREGLTPDNIVEMNKQEAMIRVARYLAEMAVVGIKQAGSSSIPAMSAGLYEQLSDNESGQRLTNTYDVSGTFNETKLRAALEQIFRTGRPDTILLSQKNKDIINAFNNNYIQTARTDNTAGVNIENYRYGTTDLKLVVDAACTDDKVALLEIGKCKKGWQTGDELRFKDEPAKSTRELRGSLQGSIGFEVEDVGYAHCLMYNIS